MVSLANGFFLLLVCSLNSCVEFCANASNIPKPPAKKAISPIEPKPCEAVSKCVVDANTEPVCRYDDNEGCVRKYESLCHLKIAACKAKKDYADYSNIYCSMETYLCEEGYGRWTIFFGYE
ncbi:uncharacterized protein LOC118746956, partial [Rhagoletis pomonella]|uniref:uncharacterized protein LOC118746956 n=1 Tax=Rhagoletis pomonella TaxID=28610 RepID=UPI00177E9346